MTLEQQLDAVMASASIGTLCLFAHREDDGAVRFYTVMHGNEGGCVYSDLMNLPTANEAVSSGINALNKKRIASAEVATLAPMEIAA